ncbi:unnamed protein product [Prorocentrum cordatum]|uniref:Uncharacterized protein n=1 Tax=Prorocentrum cordatum TaxID=2364126 RepID=A0ABN9TW59_9DINO|nr:unnamed protein product [Polarella glacialis]
MATRSTRAATPRAAVAELQQCSFLSWSSAGSRGAADRIPEAAGCKLLGRHLISYESSRLLSSDPADKAATNDVLGSRAWWQDQPDRALSLSKAPEQSSDQYLGQSQFNVTAPCSLLGREGP